MGIDTHLDATPSDIRTSATDIGDTKDQVDSCETHLIDARKKACDLEGCTATSVLISIGQAITSCEDLETNLNNYKTALDDFASSMESAKTSLEGIRSRAFAGDLTLSGETINKPSNSYPDGPDQNNPEEVEAARLEQEKIRLYNELETETSDIRTKETEARQAFADACAAIGSSALSKLGPTTSTSGPVTNVNGVAWGIDRAKDANDLARGTALYVGNARVRKFPPQRYPRGLWDTQ